MNGCMPFASSNGPRPGARRPRAVRIHYTVDGPEDGTPVVLLQGLGLSGRFWFDVPSMLADDRDRPRRVVCIDNRGTGQSDKPRTPWTMAAMADDVVAVLDHAGIESAFVVGISMGGMIAQQLALRHPERVRGLVLIATTAGFLLGALPEVRAIGRLVALPFGGTVASTSLVRLLLPEAKWPRAKEIFRGWPRAIKEDPLVPWTFAAHLFASCTHLVTRRLSKVTCPAIVVAGAHDQLIPAKNAEVLARSLRRAELEVIADAGHAVYAEDRDLVRRMVQRLEASVEIGLEGIS